jgi:ABC-2 type transport system ATP-binding protein
MITIHDLTFWYSKRNKVFGNLDLELEPGHIFGLLGKNGAGKTTLLKLICGLSFPKSGKVEVDGQIPCKRHAGFLENLFFVPEEISLPSMSPEKFARTYGDFYPAFNAGQFGEYLARLEVTSNRNFNRMSHGQKRKALIAFALAANTRFLFLDEPTNGFDIPSKAAFRSLLASAFSEEKTIILSTHMVRDLESMIDRVLILEDHRIIQNNEADQNLEDLFNASVNPAVTSPAFTGH